MHPRSSFKAYEEMSEGASRAWEPEDIQLAQALQTSLRRSVSHELERSSNETRLLLMVQELNHRVRNVLSMMQSIAQQSKVEGIDIDEYADTLRQRLLALATAHDLLAQTDNAGISLKDAITLELAPFASQVTQIEGPDLRLAPNAATLVVLVLHEIVTNAAKYGGFSTPSGRARVQWGLEADILVLRWREEGSPAQQGKRSQGFGTFLIQKGVSHQLGGQAEMAFGDGWGEVTLRIPKSVLLADQPPQSTVGAEQIEAPPGIQGGLAMERVLVVEDNFLVAAEVEDVLKGLGIKTVLLAANNAEAQNLIAQEAPDFALLDVNLGAEDSEPTAKVLEKSDIPFIFLTGYADDFGWLSGYENRGILNKPLRPGSIQIALERSWTAAKGS